MRKCKKISYLLILDILFARGKCTSDDVSKELPDKRVKIIRSHLREMEKLDLVTITVASADESRIKEKPHNFYSLKCNCPLPGETDNCKSCPSGKLIREWQECDN
jgi:hypothetical protein